jgi:hypothetical protein
VTESNRRRGSGSREKVSSRRINLKYNTYVLESNARNIPEYLSLFQLAKTLCASYYCLHSLFNKIRDKDKTVSAWKLEGEEERSGAGKKGGGGRQEKWPKHCMHI